MIVAHFIVGPGEADRYLQQVLDRAAYWADHVHVALDREATDAEWQIADSTANTVAWLDDVWTEHEGKFRQAAWRSMESNVRVTEGDYVFCIDADEIVFDHNMVRLAAREYSGKRISWLFHEMWSDREYRVDGHWKPYPAAVLIPYREKASFQDRRLASGREPTYAMMIPTSRVVGNMLHYGYAREVDRKAKYQRYMALDGGEFHNRSHLESILQPPTLKEWNRGGLLDV